MTPVSTQKTLPDALDLQDRLDDLMTGFEFWKKHKISSMALTEADEMLLRWVAYNQEHFS